MTNATAQVNSEPCRPRRRTCRRGRAGETAWRGNASAVLRAWASAMIASLALDDRVFGQNLPDPLERFLRRRLRRHPFPDHVGLRRAPDLLGVGLGIAGVEDGVIRHRRIHQALAGISRHVRILGVEPEGVAFDEIRHRRQPSAQPRFQVFIVTFGWIRYFRKSLAPSTFFAPFGTKGPMTASCAGICLPALSSGKPIVTMSSYSSFLWYNATSGEIVPSMYAIICLAWNALLSSASFQLSAPGGT